MLDELKKGVRCAFRNRLRSFLTITGIAVGVASVVLVSSIGNIGVKAINAELTGMGMDSLVISASALNEDSLYAIKNVNNVSDAMPLINKLTAIESHGKVYSTMAWGVNENADKVIDLEVKYGRLINRGDLAQLKKVCVVDEAVAINSHGRENAVGKTITVDLNGVSEDFEIIGVVKNGVNTLQSMLGGFIPDFIYVPYTVMQEYTSSDKFDNITVRLKEESRSQETSELIRNTLSSTSESVNVENLLRQKDEMNNIMGIASAALSVVAGISIVVSGISIMTVMLVAVSERTREIGIKKSIGATTFNIMAEFLLESVLITMIGGIAGIVGGSLITYLLCIFTGTEPFFNTHAALSMLVVSVVIGIVFGVYPARKAAKLNPAEALRRE